jgi:hypothetical protein
LHSFADGAKEVIGLLGREDESDDDLFFEWGDIEQGILLKDPSSNQETEEAPGDAEHMVYGDGLHRKVAPHVEEKRRLKGTQIGATLRQITIKDAEVVIAGAKGIS